MGLLDSLLSVLLPDPLEIDPDEDMVFVDVRTEAEYRRKHVKGAKHIPHTEMGDRWTELRGHKDERILVYCASGSRSKQATRVLQSKGFSKAENAGGLGGLKRAGVEVE